MKLSNKILFGFSGFRNVLPGEFFDQLARIHGIEFHGEVQGVRSTTCQTDTDEISPNHIFTTAGVPLICINSTAQRLI